MNIQKTIINAPSRQLTATYTVEPLQMADKPMVEIADTLMKEIQEEIDWGIIVDLLSASGWTLVEIQHENYVKNQTEIDSWVAISCKDEYKNRMNSWLFKSKDEAAWFMLRWS